MINRKSTCLAVMALAINLLFFAAHYRNNYFLNLLRPQGEIAYNFVTQSSIKINNERCAHIRDLEKSYGRMVDYAEVDHTPFGAPDDYCTGKFDTPWYGIILGILWLCTKSFCYHDIQILQIVIFSFLMFLIYGLALLLFQNARIAFAIGLCHLLFLPLTYQNVQALRDIWVYYALVVLIWSLAAYYKRVISLPVFAGCIALFSFFELVRPTSSYSFTMAALFFIVFGYLQKNERYRLWKAVGVMVCTNLLFFWGPFVTYNQIAYGRPVISAWGIFLLEGLGEYENPWGFQLNDDWAEAYLKEKYNVRYGTGESGDRATEEFFKALKENPWHFIRSVLRRLPLLVLPDFPWVSHFLSPTRMVHLFLILGYLGLFLMMICGEYFAASLLTLVGILPAYHCIISHIEYRYIITFYAFFSFGVGYLMVILRDIWCNRRLTSIKEG